MIRNILISCLIPILFLGGCKTTRDPGSSVKETEEGDEENKVLLSVYDYARIRVMKMQLLALAYWTQSEEFRHQIGKPELTTYWKNSGGEVSMSAAKAAYDFLIFKSVKEFLPKPYVDADSAVALAMNSMVGFMFVGSSAIGVEATVEDIISRRFLMGSSAINVAWTGSLTSALFLGSSAQILLKADKDRWSGSSSVTATFEKESVQKAKDNLNLMGSKDLNDIAYLFDWTEKQKAKFKDAFSSAVLNNLHDKDTVKIERDEKTYSLRYTFKNVDPVQIMKENNLLTPQQEKSLVGLKTLLDLRYKGEVNFGASIRDDISKIEQFANMRLRAFARIGYSNYDVMTSEEYNKYFYSDLARTNRILLRQLDEVQKAIESRVPGIKK